MKNIEFNPDKAFQDFFSDSDWSIKTGIGGLINALAIVLLFVGPVFIPVSVSLIALNFGYLIKTINHKLEGNENLPPFNGFIDLLLSGLNWLSLWSSYFIIFVLISGIILFTAICFNAFDIDSNLFYITSSLTFIVIFMLWLKFNFILNYTIVDFAKTYKPKPFNAITHLTRYFFQHPLAMLVVFLLNSGLFVLSIIIPVLTVFAVFLIPSFIFVISIINTLLTVQVYRGVETS